MFRFVKIHRSLLFLFILAATMSSAIAQASNSSPKDAIPVLWRDPGSISARDLVYGPGSAELAPTAPFTFLEEDKDGVSPKIRVQDARGVVWTIKLGEEAQSETVSTRIVWAVGYFADETYYFHKVEVQKMPRLSRGAQHVEGSGRLRGARFEPNRPNMRSGTTWDWRKNPFVGTRELDGLKVLMVLLANYDTSPANNHIITTANPESGTLEDRYVVTDLGATLGHVGGLGGKRSKNDLEDFRQSKFVVEVEDGMVEFDYRTRPQKLGIFASVFNPWYGKSQSGKEKAMRRIPVHHARWIGTLLADLTDDQLRSAFHAAGYERHLTEGFVETLRARINQLTNLNADGEGPGMKGEG